MISKMLVASVLAASAAATFAESYVAPAPILLDPTVANQSVVFSIPAKAFAGSFTDIVTFQFTSVVPWESSAAGTVIQNRRDGTPDVDFSAVSLNGILTLDIVNGALVSRANTPSVDFNTLNNPAYTLAISGIAEVGGTYAGSLNVAVVPVPEPETYLMMLAGLGAVGFVVARRRNRA